MKAALMHETGVMVVSLTVSACVAVVLYFSTNAIGDPMPAFLNGWVSALAYISSYRWLNKGGQHDDRR